MFLKFEPMDFVANLPYMGKGMAIIFVVIGVIVAVTAILNRIFSNKNKSFLKTLSFLPVFCFLLLLLMV